MDLNRKKLPAQDQLLEIITLHGPTTTTNIWNQTKHLKITPTKFTNILNHLLNTGRIQQEKDQYGTTLKTIT